MLHSKIVTRNETINTNDFANFSFSHAISFDISLSLSLTLYAIWSIFNYGICSFWNYAIKYSLHNSSWNSTWTIAKQAFVGRTHHTIHYIAPLDWCLSGKLWVSPKKKMRIHFFACRLNRLIEFWALNLWRDSLLVSAFSIHSFRICSWPKIFCSRFFSVTPPPLKHLATAPHLHIYILY